MHRSKHNARTLKRAQVLLKVAGGWTASEIADTFDVSPSIVANACRRFREGGVYPSGEEVGARCHHR